MSERCVYAMKMPFGKYRGVPLGRIAEKDILYLDWLVGRDLSRFPELADALRVICDENRRRIADLIEDREEWGRRRRA